MSKATELFAEAKAKASAALEVESDDERKALVEQAEALMAKANEIKAAEEIISAANAPVKTVELPVDDNNGTAPKLPENEPQEDQAVKAAYVMRYGESDSAIKAILRDLHGDDYEQKRLSQWQGFARYLRTGEGESREFLWTPDTIKMALGEGQDVKAMKTVMVEAQDTLGGYAVPVDWQADVISRMAGYTVVRPMARVVQTSRDRIEWPTMTGGGSQYRDAVRVTWVDETPTAATAATNLTLGSEVIPVHTVMAETFLSRNLVEDAAFNLVDWLADSFASAQAIDEDNKFLVGDGNGCPQGVLADSGVTGWLGTGQQVVSGSASTLTWDGLIALTYKLDAQYRQNAVFVMEKATAEVIAKLKDSDGQYLWRERYGDNVSVGGAGTVQRLLGYPVLEQEGMPTVASNAFPIIFGDFSGYVVADRVGMSIERYLGGEEARINQVLYVARRRLGGQGVATWKFAAQKCST